MALLQQPLLAKHSVLRSMTPRNCTWRSPRLSASIAEFMVQQRLVLSCTVSRRLNHSVKTCRCAWVHSAKTPMNQVAALLSELLRKADGPSPCTLIPREPDATMRPSDLLLPASALQVSTPRGDDIHGGASEAEVSIEVATTLGVDTGPVGVHLASVRQMLSVRIVWGEATWFSLFAPRPTPHSSHPHTTRHHSDRGRRRSPGGRQLAPPGDQPPHLACAICGAAAHLSSDGGACDPCGWLQSPVEEWVGGGARAGTLQTLSGL